MGDERQANDDPLIQAMRTCVLGKGQRGYRVEGAHLSRNAARATVRQVCLDNRALALRTVTDCPALSLPCHCDRYDVLVDILYPPRHHVLRPDVVSASKHTTGWDPPPKRRSAEGGGSLLAASSGLLVRHSPRLEPCEPYPQMSSNRSTPSKGSSRSEISVSNSEASWASQT